jgi:hypothetical protein
MDPNNPPIIHFNTLKPTAFKATKYNQLIINCMFYLRKKIESADDIQSEIFEDFLLHFSE